LLKFREYPNFVTMPRYLLVAILLCHALMARGQALTKELSNDNKKVIFTAGLTGGVHVSTLDPTYPFYKDKMKYSSIGPIGGIFVNAGNILRSHGFIQYSIAYNRKRFDEDYRSVVETDAMISITQKKMIVDLSSLTQTLQFDYALYQSGFSPVVSVGAFHAHIFDKTFSEATGSQIVYKGDLSGGSSSGSYGSVLVSDDYGFKIGVGVLQRKINRRTFYVSINWMKGFGLKWEGVKPIDLPWYVGTDSGSIPLYWTKETYHLKSSTLSLEAGLTIF
jgi:hypothetical protein